MYALVRHPACTLLGMEQSDESEFLRLLALRLTAARKARGLKVADVARAMPEVSAGIVGHWFRGIRKPQLDNLRKLAGILEVSLSSLLEDDPQTAVTKEERLLLEMFRSTTPELRQATLALMRAQSKPN